MAEFLASIPLFPVVLTIGTYLFGVWCQKKTRSPICNPILVAVVLLALQFSTNKFYQLRFGNAVTTSLLFTALNGLVTALLFFCING